MGDGVLGAGVNRGDEQGPLSHQQGWWVWTRGCGCYEGDEQKSEAGKQRCTVINMDEAGFSWSCSKQSSARAGFRLHVKISYTEVPCITCPDRQEVCKMPAGPPLSLHCLVTHKVCCAAVLCATSSVVRQSYVAVVHVTMPSCMCSVVQRCRPVVKASSPACRTQNTACTAATAGQQGQLMCFGKACMRWGHLCSKDEWVVALVFELPPLGLA